MRLPDAERSRAVLIGTSTYAEDSGFESLPQVRTNLERLEGVLRRDTGLRHVSVVLDPASPDEFEDALMPAVAEAEDLLLFYFAGHGMTFDRQLALTHTGSRASSRYRTLAYSAIRDDLHATRAPLRVVILDCCHSGSAITTGGHLSGDEEQMRELSAIDGAYIITATGTSDRLASAHGPDDCTAFTGTLLQVLAEGERTPDAMLTLSTTVRLLRRRLAGLGFPRPEDVRRSEAGELALVRNAGRVAGARATRASAATAAPQVVEHLVVGAQSAATATWIDPSSGRTLVAEASGPLHEWPARWQWPDMPAGTRYVSAGGDGRLLHGGYRRIDVFVVQPGVPVSVWIGSERAECHAARICRCGEHIALGILETHRVAPRSTGHFKVINLKTGVWWKSPPATKAGIPNCPSAVGFADDCSRVALSTGNAVTVLNLESQDVRQLSAESGWATAVAFDKTGRLLARCTKNGWIEVWDLASDRHVYGQKWHDDVWAVDVDGTRGIVAFGTEDGAHVASLRSKEMSQPVRLTRCRSIALRDDGVLAVIGSRNTDAAPSMKRIKTWNLPGDAIIGPVILATVAVGD